MTDPLKYSTETMDTDEPTKLVTQDELRDPDWINTDGFLSFLQILEVVFRAYAEQFTLLSRDNSESVKHELVEMVRVLMILSCDETVEVGVTVILFPYNV